MGFEFDFSELPTKIGIKAVNLKLDEQLHKEFKKNLVKLNITSQKDFFELAMIQFNKYCEEKEKLEPKN